MEHTDSELSIYTDAELRQAVQELFGYPAFLEGMKSFLPPALNQLILQVKDGVANVYDFQKAIIVPFLNFIQEIGITQRTASGLENLHAQERYLFMSNHRDIVLDSAFLNYILYEHGLPTSRIAIGDNLMAHRIAELLFRINKSFAVKRSGTPRELYEHSLQLSHYIRRSIVQGEDSVWIAQREGRTKDGNDQTHPGLLNMLSMSGKEDIKTHLHALRIVPVAISYEYNPCAVLKTEEFLEKQTTGEAKKSFQNDMQHILLGLRGHKGRLHYHFDKPLDEELNILDTSTNRKQQLEWTAEIIDRSIHRHYRLYPVNYIAHDILTGTAQYEHLYSPEEFRTQEQYFDAQVQMLSDDRDGAGRHYLLAMYANPVINAAAALSA
ncbi:MAG: 1-acyl-sn-glycerol-3-phosphate acyltransferase [Saprospiraceae bacterium]|nr:1-acyl-sn-glycerol-3-phosphate acyltransferase [Saprospiraceae bacterium]